MKVRIFYRKEGKKMYFNPRQAFFVDIAGKATDMTKKEADYWHGQLFNVGYWACYFEIVDEETGRGAV